MVKEGERVLRGVLSNEFSVTARWVECYLSVLNGAAGRPSLFTRFGFTGLSAHA